MNIGEKIKNLRVEKMMTQTELAGDQVTRNMLSLIEKGRAVPSLQTLSYIASRLNVTPAFLLADEKEEKMMLKSSAISNVLLAFKNQNYRICMDLCQRIGGEYSQKDDEISLVMAESAISIAVEEIYADRIRSAWQYLDDAVMYASQTVYSTKHIEAMAGIIFEYLGELSPSLVSENMELDSFDYNSAKQMCVDNELCKYIVSLKNADAEYSFEDEALERHVACRRFMANGEYDKANSALNDILKLDVRLPGVLMYHLFEDLELCCRQLGNSKSAKTYSLEKMSQLERILS